jgi:hypothetical protein
MSIFRSMLVKVGLSERRKDGRISAHGLDVSYQAGLEQKRVKVKDISATGIYILTRERLQPGMAVDIILRKRGRLDGDLRREVRLRARCVRHGEDGMGLTFADEPARAADWSKSMAIASELMAGSHPVRLFRSTKALAFLMRIAPASEAQILPFFAGVSGEQAERIIDILIQAEELLVSHNAETKSAVSLSLLLRILDYGSKAPKETMQQSWAGLLASSCIDPSQNEAMGRLAILLSRLELEHLSILTAACTRAMRTGWQAGFVFPAPLDCPLDEVRNISGIRSPVAVERNLNHLYQLGLMGKTVRPFGCAQLDQVNMTPTALGLNLYAASCGDPALPEVLDQTSVKPELLLCPSTLEMAS